MNNVKNIKQENVDQTFNKLKAEEKILSGILFDRCHFQQCDFSNAQFIDCRFVDCEWVQCNLSSVKITNSSFSETVFAESKMLGINWTQAKWPLIKIASPIKMYQCNISHSSFFELSLTELTLENCKAHEVDFREADCSQANFTYTDFTNSLFMHTKLIKADFTEAINYTIDVYENDIKKAKFSLPEAVSLLGSLNIELV